MFKKIDYVMIRVFVNGLFAKKNEDLVQKLNGSFANCITVFLQFRLASEANASHFKSSSNLANEPLNSKRLMSILEKHNPLLSYIPEK